MELRNDGFVPLEIAVIRPAVMERGAITPAAQQAKLESLHVAQRGGLPTLDDTTEPTLIRMEFDSPRTAVGIGILPFGATEPSVVLDRSEEQWVGSVGVRFTPPLSLPPGASVRSDPVWLGVDDGISNYIRESYSWCHTVSPSARRSVDAPTSWVTMASNDPVDRLYDSARAWQRHDVNAALVPSDIREVVSALRAIGMETGVVYDPLAAGDAKAGTILTAANGSRWFAPSDRRAIEAAAAHVATLTSLGLRFYVVEPSVIPDDVLKQAGITRQEADMFAFGVLTQVAGDSPVIPSASMSLGNEPARWRAAADATAGYAKLQLLTAPIQLDAAQLTEVTPALVDSIGAFEGPIEILGIPDARVQRELGPALARGEWLGKVGVSSTVQHADSGD